MAKLIVTEQRVSKQGKHLRVWLTATILINKEGRPYAVATTERLLEK